MLVCYFLFCLWADYDTHVDHEVIDSIIEDRFGKLIDAMLQPAGPDNAEMAELKRTASNERRRQARAEKSIDECRHEEHSHMNWERGWPHLPTPNFKLDRARAYIKATNYCTPLVCAACTWSKLKTVVTEHPIHAREPLPLNLGILMVPLMYGTSARLFSDPLLPALDGLMLTPSGFHYSTLR